MSDTRTHPPAGEANSVPPSRRWLAHTALLWVLRLLLPTMDVVEADTGPG